MLPRSDTPTAPRTPKPRSVKLSPLRTVRPMPSYGTQRMRRRVDAALEDEVLEQPADLVVGERGHDRGAQAEAAPEPAGDVVLAAALPRLEPAGGADPPLARVEAEHDLAERDEVVAALVRGADREPAGHRATSAASVDRFPRQLGDGGVVPCRDQLGRHHPAAADCRHGRQREVGGRVRGADPAGRDEANVGERAPQRAQERDASGRFGREELQQVEPLVERGDHLGRGRHPGDHEHVELPAPLDHPQAQARRDDESGARRHRLVDLLRPHDRAGSDEDIRLGGDAPDRSRPRPPSGR